MAVEDLAAIVQAAGSVVLIAVTGWYVWLTKSLAKSAQISAASSAEAAAASKKALSAQLALVPVTFEFEPLPPRDSREAGLPIHALRVKPTGANVWLHSLRIKDEATPYGPKCRWLGVATECAFALDPDGGQPRYLQNGEMLEAVVLARDGDSSAAALGTPRSDIVALQIGVFFSLEIDGPQLSKSFEWRDPDYWR